MKRPIITSADGKSHLNLEQPTPLVELLGYQIEHISTGRILPQTQRHEVFSKHAAIEKVVEVANYQLDIGEPIDYHNYRLVPVYDFEMSSGYIVRLSNKDFV